MSGGATNVKEAEILDADFGSGTPATWYIGLLTDSNTDAQRDAGTVTEVSTSVWTNYARKALTNNTTNFPAASGTNPTVKSNGAAFDFGVAAITGTPPVINAVGVFTASTGGTMKWWAPMTVAQTISNGNTLNFATGQFQQTCGD